MMPAGIQTQTAECIVIGEITTQDLVVVLNKIGMWGSRRVYVMKGSRHPGMRLLGSTAYILPCGAVLLPLTTFSSMPANHISLEGTPGPLLASLLSDVLALTVELLVLQIRCRRRSVRRPWPRPRSWWQLPWLPLHLVGAPSWLWPPGQVPTPAPDSVCSGVVEGPWGNCTAAEWLGMTTACSWLRGGLFAKTAANGMFFAPACLRVCFLRAHACSCIGQLCCCSLLPVLVCCLLPSSVHVHAGAREGEGVEQQQAVGIPELVETLVGRVRVRKKGASAPFLFHIDHCFGIRGQGTVLTGAVA